MVSKPLIMVVEDDVEYAAEIADTLRSGGKYDVVVANSGAEAFTTLSRHKSFFGLHGNRVKLIFLDIKMPGMNGLQFLAELRKDYDDAAIGVIMLTAYEDEEKWEQATSGFVAGYLNKPYDRNELLEQVDKFFSDPRARCKMTLRTFEKQMEKKEEFRRQGNAG